MNKQYVAILLNSDGVFKEKFIIPPTSYKYMVPKLYFGFMFFHIPGWDDLFIGPGNVINIDKYELVEMSETISGYITELFLEHRK